MDKCPAMSIFESNATQYAEQCHYIQFRKEKEYAKVLRDNEILLAKLRDGGIENDVSEVEIHQLLVLRDFLVNRFGTGKTAS